MRRLALVLACVPLFFAQGLSAEEATLSPAEAFTKVVKAMPTPAAGEGYVFQGTVYMGERKLGPAEFRAVPVRDGESVGWRLVELANLMGGTFRTEQIALLTQELGLVRGALQTREQRRSADGVVAQETKLEWKRVASKIQAQVQCTGSEATTVELEAGGATLVGVGGVMLFAQYCPAEDARYEAEGFDASDIGVEGKDPRRAVTFTVKAKGTYGERPAMVFERASETEGSSFVYVDPETRAILAIERETAPGQPRMRVIANAPAGPQSAFEGPATSAKEAAMRAAFALGAHHEGTLDSIVHWPSVHEAMKSRLGENPPTVEAFRKRTVAAIMANLKKGDAPPPAEQIRMVLESIMPTLKETPQKLEGYTVVTFPEAFRNLQLKVGKVGEAWFLVRLPGT